MVARFSAVCHGEVWGKSFLFFSLREVDEEVPEAEDVPPAEEKTVAEGLEASATGLGKPRSR